MARKRSPTLADAESRVMSVLWQRETATVGDVAALTQERAVTYSTVKQSCEPRRRAHVTHESGARLCTLGRRRASSAPPGVEAFRRALQWPPSLLVLNVLEDGVIDRTELRRLKKLIRTPKGAPRGLHCDWLVQGCVVAPVTVVIVRCLPRGLAATRYLVLGRLVSCPRAAAGGTHPVASPVQGVTVDTTASELWSRSSVPDIRPAHHRRGWYGRSMGTARNCDGCDSTGAATCRSFRSPGCRLRNWTRVKHQGQLRNSWSHTTRSAADWPWLTVIAVAPALVRTSRRRARSRRITVGTRSGGTTSRISVRSLQAARRVASGCLVADRWPRAEREVACDEMAADATGSSRPTLPVS
jgi:hypothetical protein